MNIINNKIVLSEYSQEQYKQEYSFYKNSPIWELKNIKKALSIMELLNTDIENARLKAVKDLIKLKR